MSRTLGTLRYPGWCETWQKLVELGLLDLTEREDLTGMTYRQLLAHLIGCPETADLRRDLAVHLNLPEDSPVYEPVPTELKGRGIRVEERTERL